MYESFYNLKLPPFENTPDPRFWYESEQHCEALATIEYTIRLRKGFALVTGDIGSGKTTVARTMLERLGSTVELVQVSHSHREGIELLLQVLRALEVKTRNRDDHSRLLERLSDRLMDGLHRRRPVVIFVDEAQTLTDNALEELRLMSTFDTNTEKAVQIVMIGQPELRQRLRSPNLAALRQRIVMAKQLHPLERADTAKYIRHRLNVASAGGRPNAEFDNSALNRIYQVTRGVPRLINVVSDNCLVLGMVRNTRRITAPLVNQVAQDMMPDFEDTSATQDTRPPLSLAGNF